MSDPRSEERLAHDEANYGRCPACDEVLAYDYEQELIYCPYEASWHPEIPSMLAVQALPPADDLARFLVGATSVDGRSTTIEVVLHGSGGPEQRRAAAERIARSLVAAGARRGTFHFSSDDSEADHLPTTLLGIKERGFAAFTSLSKG